MLGYVTHFAGNNFEFGAMGQTETSQQRSVTPARARIAGGAFYDLDGLYTYPAEQQFTARFQDRDPNTHWYALSRLIGRSGWLVVKTTDAVHTQVINWAKLISLDGQSEPGAFATSSRRYNGYSATWLCSPYWYQSTDTTYDLTTATLRTVSQNGTARSNWWTLYITSAIATSLTITLSQANAYTYGTFLYGNDPFNGPFYTASTTQEITYATSKPANSLLVIDGRTNSVKLNGFDAYNNITLPSTQPTLGYLYENSHTRFTFSTAVTGSLVVRSAFI